MRYRTEGVQRRVPSCEAWSEPILHGKPYAVALAECDNDASFERDGHRCCRAHRDSLFVIWQGSKWDVSGDTPAVWAEMSSMEMLPLSER